MLYDSKPQVCGHSSWYMKYIKAGTAWVSSSDRCGDDHYGRIMWSAPHQGFWRTEGPAPWSHTQWWQGFWYDD